MNLLLPTSGALVTFACCASIPSFKDQLLCFKGIRRKMQTENTFRYRKCMGGSFEVVESRKEISIGLDKRWTVWLRSAIWVI